MHKNDFVNSYSNPTASAHFISKPALLSQFEDYSLRFCAFAVLHLTVLISLKKGTVLRNI